MKSGYYNCVSDSKRHFLGTIHELHEDTHVSVKWKKQLIISLLQQPRGIITHETPYSQPHGYSLIHPQWTINFSDSAPPYLPISTSKLERLWRRILASSLRPGHRRSGRRRTTNRQTN